MAEQAFTPLLEISQHTNAKLHAIVVANGSNIATLPTDEIARAVSAEVHHAELGGPFAHTGTPGTANRSALSTAA
jgi:hypothetical protein